MSYRSTSKKLMMVLFPLIVLFIMSGCASGGTGDPDLEDPVINSVAHEPIPANAGEVVSIIVDASDDDGLEPALRYDFDGDGAFETADNTRIYDAAGTKQVGIRAEDRAGNRTTHTYVFQVFGANGEPVLAVNNQTQSAITLFIDGVSQGIMAAGTTREFVLLPGISYSVLGQTATYNWGPEAITLGVNEFRTHDLTPP